MISNPASLQSGHSDQDLKMSGFATCFASVMCLLVILTGKSSALIWRPTVASEPTDPNDPYYQAFQTVPSPSVTANKLMTNFLHIPQKNQRLFKRSPPRIEDIVIVMDGSGSIGSCEFNKGKMALKYMLGQIDPKRYDRNYAAVTFSSTAVVDFKFLPYSTAANKIMEASYPGGGTNTPAGLAQAKNLLFDDPSSGRRSNSFKYVLLVTDGQSNDPSSTEASAKVLKEAGVEIHVVGVGAYIYGIHEMVRVASTKPFHPATPDNKLLYRVTSYKEFWTVVKLMLEEVAPKKWEAAKNEYEPPCPY